MDHVINFIPRIIIHKIRGRTLHEFAPEQYCIMANKETKNVIFVLRTRFVKRVIAKQTDIYIYLIDYRKTIGTVRHKLLAALLQSLGINKSETQLLTTLYRNQTAAVRCDKKTSEWMGIKQGVRECCVASSHLFDMIIKEIDNMNGIRIGRTAVTIYADDMIIISESEEQV